MFKVGASVWNDWMDTNSNIPANKEIDSVEILHESKLGYGPQGTHTRKQWRAECLENLLAGKERFEDWQASWQNNIKENLPEVSFECLVQYKDGNTKTVLAGNWEKQNAYALDFSCVTFVALAVFDYEFTNDVCFSGCTFVKTAGFANTKFRGVTDFTAVFFKNAAWFSNSLFAKDVWFQDVVFSEAGYFDLVTFTRDAWFDRSVFLEVITFSSSIFQNRSGFTKEHFDSECVFDGSIFGYLASFESATLANVGHFEKAIFWHQFPSFRGCRIDHTRLEFSDKDQFPRFEGGTEAIKNISFLKRLSDEQGQIDQALMFNAIELNAKRAQARSNTQNFNFKQKLLDTDFWFAKATTLYEWFSDYGRSFTKPIFWYGVLICLSALFAMIYSTYSDSPAEEQQVLCKPIKDQPSPLKLPYGRAVVEYAMFRAGGLMDFTDTGKQNNAVNCRLFEEPIEPPLMRAWGIFKGIASIALLFLAALGLRNKYRIK